jgi:hypothetical protein
MPLYLGIHTIHGGATVDGVARADAVRVPRCGSSPGS